MEDYEFTIETVNGVEITLCTYVEKGWVQYLFDNETCSIVGVQKETDKIWGTLTHKGDYPRKWDVFVVDSVEEFVAKIPDEPT